MKSGPQFVSGVIKNLERRFGSPVDYYQPLTRGTDLATGVQTVTYTSLTLKRILLLPFKISRGFIYDTAYLSAGNGDAKNFSFGALHDKDESTIVVRTKELRGLAPQMGDHISWNALRFDVKDIAPYPDIQMYIINVARTQSSKDFYFRVQSNVFFEGTAQ